MKRDLIVAGVGGQGVVAVSAIIASSALDSGLRVKQSEAHGMSQRGGAVVTHLRLSDATIHSDLIARGSADLVVSMEPLESLRYVGWLSPSGTLLTSSDPVRNFGAYPDLDEILDAIRRVPGALVIDAERIAREAGGARAANMVIVGATSARLPIDPERIESRILRAFSHRAERVVRLNIEAFRAGRAAVACLAA